jgi:hypothetical protein
MRTRPDAATRHVVERCPRCGVEHDARAGECEACQTPLRYWCRAHGRETGWLDGPACARCAQETARPAPRRRAAALPCPDFSSAAAGVAPPAATPAPREKVPADAARRPARAYGPAGHAFVMFLILLMAAGGGALAGVVLGFALTGPEILAVTALRWGIGGGVAGLAFGGWTCADYVKNLRNAPPEP